MGDPPALKLGRVAELIVRIEKIGHLVGYLVLGLCIVTAGVTHL
jgi:hypothetical protein